MYKQTDYPQLALGNSGLHCDHFGCTAIDVVNALNLAGYDVTPESFFEQMNAHGGFNYQGLLVWAVVSQVYPQFHFGGQGYDFVQGTWGRFNHWLLRHNGILYDPYTGTEGAPAGWVANGTVRTAAIDQATPPAPPAPEYPKDVEVVAGPLHVRTSPDVNASVSSTLAVGSTFKAVGEETGGEYEINGQTSNIWVKSSFDHYVAKLGVK